ncbi:hypothetical protein HYDPIDRAFT_105474 [Hydnomerulius pinastri MD-312]|nr:hypothetical protein HYDPIDRAFT_105474 [Hydnomerulius pinastri MD-312]
MHRFRKKSDSTRPSPVFLDNSFTPASEDEHHLLPELPPASNFRTSLILPDLTRRFSLLRTSSGDPISLDHLRLRFAEQRAKGVPNQISEAEEDMILETLGRIRSKNATSTISRATRDDPNTSGNTTDTGVESDYTPERTSHLSNNTTSTTYPASSITSSPSSPSSRSTKRYSNNLFSSGRLRDYGYLRTVSQRSGSHRSAVSITQTESSQSLREETSLGYSESLRPTTPEGSGPASSVPSSPNEKTPVARTASLVSSNEDLPPHPNVETNSGGPRISTRASAALAQVIQEFEEEAEDEIVMPRTAHPVPRHSDTDHSRVVDDTTDSGTSNQQTHLRSSHYEAGTAISSDKQITIESDTQRLSPTPYGRPGTVSPSPRLPGYIPGMPRPMTPRDSAFDSDDIRSHSTTPRAMSPMLPNLNGQMTTTSFSSGMLRRGSDASRSTPRPTSPQTNTYLSRSNSGRRTPDASQRDSTSGTEQEGSVTSSVFVRRRPVSPLSGPAFQPMAVSPRPSTPSNVTWNVGPSASPEKVHSKPESRSTHSRSGSLSTESDFQASMDHSKSPSRTLRSPVPPDSPSPAQTSFASKWNRTASPGPTDQRAPSSLSSYEFGSFGSRTFRSPTPTQSRNAASSTFLSSDSNAATVRSSKQHFKSPSNYSYGVSQLSLSPIANSSRSSLESTGSSYHSWDPSQKKHGAFDLFGGGADDTQPAWHDLDKSSSATPGSSQDDCDFEDIIRRYAGLTKSDFVAIQDRLVGAAVHKATLPDTRERANSLRRRRPSTSQSNYSTNGRESRVASPTPTQTAPIGRRSPAPDNSAKASALLESVMDSIPATTINVESKVEDNVQPEVSPTTRRNRDLARALGFGNDDSHLIVPQSSDQESSSTSVSPTVEAILPLESPQETEGEGPPNPAEVRSLPPTLSPSPFPQRSQSMRNPPAAPVDQTELAKEVQRKVDAATAALMKTSSGQKFSDINASTISVSRKKISASQISEPRLLSAPTSVETIPLPQPMSPQSTNPQASLNITQRMRRLRNTLRVKPSAPMGEEITPFPMDIQPHTAPLAPPPAQSLSRRPTLPLRFGPGSSTDLGKLKAPNSSPPAAATPGLKGLMARFRKPRTADNTGDSHSSVHSRTSPTTSSPTASSHHGHARGNVVSPTPTATTVPNTSAEASTRPSVDASATLSSDVDSAAVRQLFEAAHKIGLDQVALNDLLARSTSVSRTTGWGMSGGSSSSIIGNRSPTPATRPSNIMDRNRPATPSDNHPTDDDPVNGADDKTVRKLAVRKPGEPSQTRQNPENSAVIRRTLIFPSELRASKVDLSQMTRKPSTKRHRRSGSSTSAQSARSVQDRAPTPPPPKFNGGRRFSTDRSPPVPTASTSIAAQAEALLRAPTSNAVAEKSNSAYESLYDMYSGESKHTSAVVDDAGTEHGRDGPATQEGPALEVVEMANGETIWSIVNGLRDDDIESLYANRTSLGSEYSTRENGDGLQIFVKEHARSTSKGSNSSFLSRKKTSQSKNRPETKVFYSSSTQIGRLIESLSQGMDAGSFNFVPNHPPDRSAPSSFHSDADMHWTVEERLEHMLGTMRNS